MSSFKRLKQAKRPTQHADCPQAEYIRFDTCPEHGQPVLVLIAEDGRELAMAHIFPEAVDALIANIRLAADKARQESQGGLH